MNDSSENQEPQLLRNRWENESAVNSVSRPHCQCMDAPFERRNWPELILHREHQDTNCSGWKKLLELIDLAAKDGRETFSPSREMEPSEWSQIVTLPKSIAKLTAVKHFILYGSCLVRIPPEIGEMTALEQFTPYTSYRLHWFRMKYTVYESSGQHCKHTSVVREPQEQTPISTTTTIASRKFATGM